MTPTSHLKALTQRLEKVEARNRTMSAVLLAGSVALLGIVLLGQAAPRGEALEGRKLILWDAAGKKRVVLDSGKDGRPLIGLVDDGGRIRAGLTLKDGAPGLFLRTAEGKEALRLALDPSGPALILSDGNQIARTGLAIVGGRPGLFLRDANRKQRLSLTVQGDAPALFFMDADEQTRLSLSIHDEMPGMYLIDGSQETRMGLIVDQKGNPSILLRDARTRAKAALGVSERGPGIAFFDRIGDLIYAKPDSYVPPRP